MKRLSKKNDHGNDVIVLRLRLIQSDILGILNDKCPAHNLRPNIKCLRNYPFPVFGNFNKSFKGIKSAGIVFRSVLLS